MNKFIKINTVEEILELLNDFSSVFPGLKGKISSINEYAEKLAEKAEVYCGCKNENIFGLAVFYANDRRSRIGYVSLIGVKKEFEHMGLGSFLLDKCIDICKQNSMDSIMLEVDDYNIHAKKFYAVHGFKECGRTERNSSYMKKNI